MTLSTRIEQAVKRAREAKALLGSPYHEQREHAHVEHAAALAELQAIATELREQGK